VRQESRLILLPALRLEDLVQGLGLRREIVHRGGAAAQRVASSVVVGGKLQNRRL
jgi:hypothetical protein